MKINVRLLLITFSIVVLVSVSSTLIFYSLTYKILKDQHTNTILNSSNDFIFELQYSIAAIEDDFRRTIPDAYDVFSVDLDTTRIDFLFALKNDSLIIPNQFKVRKSIVLNTGSKKIRNFVTDNPNIILKYHQFSNKQTIYYGKVITSEFLNDMSEKIRSDIALIVDEAPVEISHPEKNEKYLLSIINSVKELKFKNQFDLYYDELQNVDFIASYYNPKPYLTTDVKYAFLIYSVSAEAVEFQDTMKMVLGLIIISGIALSLIFVLLLTTRLRKQISYLSEAAQIASKGELDYRVKIVTKDEIGILGRAFNRMLDELKHKSQTEKEYTEFITLLNQNPTLHEVSEATLKKIIKATSLSTGALYLIENSQLRLLAEYGISKEHAKPSQDVDYYESAINEKTFIERTFSKNHPVIKTGITEIKIEYLFIAPIIYNKNVIAVLELASTSQPSRDIKTYFENIQEQLAIGLNNALSLEQLENLVDELKKLNVEYQRQNKQILEKNEQLLELHKKLEEKASELEIQKEKAVELTKLKSQFLANISHELRTPLNSIIGLTELITKDQQILPNNKNRLGIVLRNGKKLLNLINNILEFLKIESGKIEVKRERFLISTFLEEIHDFVEPLFAEKNLQFSIEYDNGFDYLVESDKSKIEQILINLIGNAAKFTEKGSVRIKVYVTGSNDLNLEVIDTGIGISKEFQEVIFDEFRQEDSSITRKYSGTGLGLAITQKYTKLLNGSITFTSEVGVGTDFKVTLHGAVLEKLQLIVDKEEMPVDEKQESEKHRTVLVIAESEDILKLVGDYLLINKFDVYSSKTAAECVAYAVKNEPYAIILSDNLVDENSWVLLRKLKENSATKNIPVILISVISSKKVGYGLGVFDYLFSKPTREEFLSLFELLENCSAKEIKTIAVIDKSNESYNYFKSLVERTGFNFIHISEMESIKDKVANMSPCVIMVNMLSDHDDMIDVIHQLKHTGSIKKVPVIAYFDKELTNTDAEFLKQNFDNVTIKAKHHPMDVLKVLRDRLNLEYTEKVRSSILIEDRKETELLLNTNKEIEAASLNRKLRALIVDDDSDTLFTIGEIVSELGYDTVYARNGVECLLTLNNIEPDIILLDIMMPQMDGFETIKRIRSDVRFTKLPVIALTAYAMLDDKEIIEKNGFTDIVTKPINTNTLAFKLQKLLNSK